MGSTTMNWKGQFIGDSSPTGLSGTVSKKRKRKGKLRDKSCLVLSPYKVDVRCKIWRGKW